MSDGKRLRLMIGLALVLILTGCAGAQAEPPGTPMTPTATPTVVTYDYVMLGDGVAVSFASRYTKQIKADLGVEVTIPSWRKVARSSCVNWPWKTRTLSRRTCERVWR